MKRVCGLRSVKKEREEEEERGGGGGAENSPVLELEAEALLGHLHERLGALDSGGAVGDGTREEAVKVELTSLDLGAVEVGIGAGGGLELLGGGVHHAQPVVGHGDIARVVEEVGRGGADNVLAVAGLEADAAKDVCPLPRERERNMLSKNNNDSSTVQQCNCKAYIFASQESGTNLESVGEELKGLLLVLVDLVVVDELLLAVLEDPADKVKVALALLDEDLAAEEVEGLDTGGTLIQGADAGIADNLLEAPLADVAMAAKDLEGMACRLAADLGGKRLENGGHEAHVLLSSLELLLTLSDEHLVGHQSSVVEHAARALGECLGSEEHLAHITVHNEGVGNLVGVLGASKRAHGETLLGIGEGALEGKLTST